MRELDDLVDDYFTTPAAGRVESAPAFRDPVTWPSSDVTEAGEALPLGDTALPGWADPITAQALLNLVGTAVDLYSKVRLSDPAEQEYQTQTIAGFRASYEDLVLRIAHQSSAATCHCGLPVLVHFGLDGPGSVFERGLCRDCDAVRCDAYPGECGRN